MKEKAVALWDPGSTLSFITFTLASKLNMQGEPVELEIITVGGVKRTLDSQKYSVLVMDAVGQKIKMQVLGIDRISTEIEKIDIEGVRHLFKNEKVVKAERPVTGSVDILIGFRYAAYHPAKIEEIGHLLLMENRFGLIIAGAHPHLKETTMKVVKHAIVLHVAVQLEKFHSIESLGVTCYPRCGGCLCGKCHTGGKDMTLEEEREHEMIKNGLVFNEASGRWLANYPWIKDPACLPENRQFAYATLKSTEKRLQRNLIHAKTYQKQMEDMIDRKVAREVSQHELKNYSGPKFYIAHHDVLSPYSISTPMRVVFNSSAHIKGGLSLNDCLAKGPCLLNQLLGILLRFRQDHFGFIGDIKKMFHSIDIPMKDQMTHLFLWRNLDTNDRPRTYAMTTVNMGDRPASSIAQTALRMTAEVAKDEYPEASNLIINNSYMDDIPGSTSSQEVAMELMEDTEKILNAKGFHIKNWTFSGQKEKRERSADQIAVQVLLKKEVENEVGKVLGMEWETEADILQFRINKLNAKNETTKRECLSTICSIYDPVGLLAPVTVSAKIILRKVWAAQPSIDWDDPLPTELQREWDNFRNSLMYIRSLSFSRSVKPKDAISPVLVIFSDGSKNAYGAAAYIIWRTADGFESRLVAAKSRIAPLRIIDIVRLELCGAVLNARLFTFITREMRGIHFERVFHIIDSEIVKAMINKDSYGFSTFAANRIGEIHDVTEKKNWYWVESGLNIADLTTRTLDPTVSLDKDSEWQKGPSFLNLPMEKWPIRSETNISKLPEIKRNFVGAVVSKVSNSIASAINISRFSKLSRLLYTTARIQKLFKRFRKANSEYDKMICPKDLHYAENTWIKYIQEGMYLEIEKGMYKKLLPTVENEIIVVGGRAERWVYSTWNKQKFILLPKDHRFSQLVAEKEHIEIGHLALESTVAKIRAKYWIVGVRKIVKSIISSCRTCKEKFKMLASQRMSPLPVERIKPSPPFQNIGIDYFGPFEIKGEVQKRIRGKCYGVLFVCDSSRAVHADIVQNYSTEAFLQALRRFGCTRGYPSKIHSDNGTQLVGAATWLKKMLKELDWAEIQRFGHKFQTTWSFSSADAPWQNGSTEALIKTIKRALKVVIGAQVFSYAEFQTVMYEAAQLVNQRPIGLKPASPDEGTYLCPNDLLLGRSTNHAPQGPFAEGSNVKQRMNFIQDIVNNFWKRWSREVFPSLVIEPKWHTERRNITPGDVVLIQDSNTVRGEWRLGIVTKTLQSKDKRVRNVEIRYKNGQTDVKVTRPVQRLIVLVPQEEDKESK